MQLATKIFATAWGYVAAAASEQGLVCVVLPRKTKQSARRSLLNQIGDRSNSTAETGSRYRAREILETARVQIREYLSYKRRTFDLLIAPVIPSPFARAVWQACCGIPFGETRSYGWIAGRIGQPKSSRAVGRALGANPLPLVIPCHRVVRSDGSLGGFSSGLALKKRLLALEESRSTSRCFARPKKR